MKGEHIWDLPPIAQLARPPPAYTFEANACFNTIHGHTANVYTNTHIRAYGACGAQWYSRLTSTATPPPEFSTPAALAVEPRKAVSVAATVGSSLATPPSGAETAAASAAVEPASDDVAAGWRRWATDTLPAIAAVLSSASAPHASAPCSSAIHSGCPTEQRHGGTLGFVFTRAPEITQSYAGRLQLTCRTAAILSRARGPRISNRFTLGPATPTTTRPYPAAIPRN